MSASSVRPKVADLALHVFNRELHPELMQFETSKTLAIGKNEATVSLCRTGHCFIFRAAGETLTEVANSRHEPIPQLMRGVSRKVTGHQAYNLTGTRLRFHGSFQLELAPPDLFLHLNRELEIDGRNATLFHLEAPQPNRFGPRAVSLLRCDTLKNGLVVYAYHTYPDSGAVLRSQSLFEVIS